CAQDAARRVVTLTEQEVDRREMRDEGSVQLAIGRVRVVVEMHAHARSFEERDVEVALARLSLDELRRTERFQVRDDAMRGTRSLGEALGVTRLEPQLRRQQE